MEGRVNAVNTNDFEKTLRQLSPLDDQAVEEIAEIAPALDDAAKDRIEALCEKKMRLETMNTANQIHAEGVTNITRTQWYRPVMTTAACLLIAAGIGGAMFLGNHRPAVTPPVSTDVPATTEATTENTSTEPLPNDLSMDDLRSMMDQNVRCVDYFLLLNGVSYSSEDLGDDTHETETDAFASYAEMKEYVYSVFCDDFAEELLNGNGGVHYLEVDGKFCVKPRTVLDGVSFSEDWYSYEITNPASVDENTVTFDVTVNRIYDDGEKIPATYVCMANRESDGWRLEKLYGYDEPQINGLYLEDLRNLMYRNLDCLEAFVTNPLSHKGDYLGVGIYEVDSDQFVSYDALESYVYSTYCDEFANELLTSYPCGYALYSEYDGKFCIQPASVFDYSYPEEDWSNFEITNPAAMGDYMIVFDVTGISSVATGEEYGCTCKAIRESDGWRLEKMYGYTKPESSTSDLNDFAEEEILHELVENSMQIHGNYTLKSEPLSGTTLHEIDLSNNFDLSLKFWDAKSFRELVESTYTPEVAQWVLNDCIFKIVDDKLYIDEAKVAYEQGALVDWTHFDIEVQSVEKIGNEQVCTFRAVATDDPNFQFPDTTLEDRTEYFTATFSDEHGWLLSIKPEHLVK